MASFDQITRAFHSVLPVADRYGAFYIEDENNYGFVGGGSLMEVEAELTKIVNNDPILEQLAALDKFVSRAQEDLIIAANTDSFLVGKANEKKTLRSQLL